MVFGQASSQGVNLGNAHGKVTITTNAAEAMQQAQTAVSNGVRSIGLSLQSIGGSISSAGSSMMAWTAPIAAIGVAGLKTAGDFQASMKEIEARTGLTGDALDKVRNQALDLGAATEFSSQQAANAYLQLLTAGLDVEQAMAALPNVLTAATASGEDLGLMADQVTNVMSSFGLAAEDTTDIVEAMARAAASSPASMGQIGESMAAAGSIAKSYGISLEDTSAIMAIFAQRGIRGSEASTKLGSMLKIMNSGTPDSVKAWNALGTSLFNADGSARNFADVIVDIKKGLEGKTEQEKTTIMQDLAGSYGLAGINALVASDGIDAMRETMDTQQSAADVAAAKMGTFKGSITSLMGSIETLMIHALTPLMENFLTPLIQQLITVVNHMANWAKENPELTTQIGKFLTALVAIGPVLFVVGKAITLIGLAISFLASPIGLVVAGIAALGVAFVNDFGGIKSFVMPMLRNLWDWLDIIQNKIHTFVVYAQDFGVIDAIKGIFGLGENDETSQSLLEGMLFQFGMSRENAIGAVGFLVNTFNSIRDAVSGVVDTLRPLFTEIGTFLGNLFQNIDLGQLFEIGRTILSLTNPIGLAMTGLKLLGVNIGDLFRAGVEGATRFFGALNDGGTVFDGLRAAFGDSSFIDGVEAGFNGLVTFIEFTVIPGLQSLADWFTLTALPAVVTYVEDTVAPAIETFFNGLSQVWTDISPALASFYDWVMVTGLPFIKDFIELTVQPAFETFFGIIEGIWIAISPALEDVYDWFIVTGLPKIQEFLDGPVTLALTNIRDLLAGFWEFVKPGVELLKANLIPIFEFIRVNVLKPVLEMITAIIDKIIEASNMLAGGGIPGASQLQSGANSGNVNDILAGAEDVYNSLINNPFTNPFGSVVNAVNSTVMPRDSGGPGLRGMPYMIGKGAQPEVFIPETNGQFIPNFDKLLEGAGGTTIGDINVYGATNYQQGLEAGRGAGDGVLARLKSRGG